MRPKKILLAEDDSDDQLFFSDFVQMRNDVVLSSTVENGVEVISYLEQISDETTLPDLIILDQNMPKMNGLETLKTLKSNHHFSQIPVLVYSSFADENLRQKSLALGATLVFAKPYTIDGYHEMLNSFLTFVPPPANN